MVGAGKTTLLEHLKIGTVDTSEDGSVKSVVYGQTELYSWDLPGAYALPPAACTELLLQICLHSVRGLHVEVWS